VLTASEVRTMAMHAMIEDEPEDRSRREAARCRSEGVPRRSRSEHSARSIREATRVAFASLSSFKRDRRLEPRNESATSRTLARRARRVLRRPAAAEGRVPFDLDATEISPQSTQPSSF